MPCEGFMVFFLCFDWLLHVVRTHVVRHMSKGHVVRTHSDVVIQKAHVKLFVERHVDA